MTAHPARRAAPVACVRAVVFLGTLADAVARPRFALAPARADPAHWDMNQQVIAPEQHSPVIT